MSLLIAVDPGKVCGIAWAYLPDGQPQTEELPPIDAVIRVQRLLNDELGDDDVAVVCENFTPRPGIRSWEPDAIETIGMLRFACAVRGVEFKVQAVADAKRFSTNDKLNKIGWRAPSKGGHADDALRHLLLAGVQRGLVDARVLL